MGISMRFQLLQQLTGITFPTSNHYAFIFVLNIIIFLLFIKMCIEFINEIKLKNGTITDFLCK